MQKYKVSILGCGWLGLALAKELSKQYKVVCSVSSKESFKDLSFGKKIILNHDNRYVNIDFYLTDTLIISIPPRGDYLAYLKIISQYIKPNTQVILFSSISIYNQTSGRIIEKMDQNIKNPNIMLSGEKFLNENIPSLLILRLGGLMGYDRVAGKYSAGKTIAKNSYTNYVHRDDVIEIIKICIKQKITNNTFNIVAPLYISKKKLYDYNAEKYRLKKTIFLDERANKKIVCSKKMQKLLNFNFKYRTLKTICNS
jgi:nucleoside-diphosphate-sugar epimerase